MASVNYQPGDILLDVTENGHKRLAVVKDINEYRRTYSVAYPGFTDRIECRKPVNDETQQVPQYDRGAFGQVVQEAKQRLKSDHEILANAILGVVQDQLTVFPCKLDLDWCIPEHLDLLPIENLINLKQQVVYLALSKRRKGDSCKLCIEVKERD